MSKYFNVQEILSTLNDEQKKLFNALVGYVIKTRRMPTLLINYETGDTDSNFGRDPEQDLFDTFTDEQKICMDAIVRCRYVDVKIAFMVEEE